MQYGVPKNFRYPRPREDNKQPRRASRHNRKSKKKFGVKMTTRQRSWHNRLTIGGWTNWYRTEVGRDDAYRRFSNQKQWFYPTKPYYEKVEKVDR